MPLATYTGWNLFNAESGPTNLLSSMQGSYIPLSRTRADRLKVNDPRPSLEERYQNRDQYLDKISAAARDLVQGGYLRQEDVPAVMTQAGREWDLAWSNGATTNGSRP